MRKRFFDTPYRYLGNYFRILFAQGWKYGVEASIERASRIKWIQHLSFIICRGLYRFGAVAFIFQIKQPPGFIFSDAAEQVEEARYRSDGDDRSTSNIFN